MSGSSPEFCSSGTIDSRSPEPVGIRFFGRGKSYRTALWIGILLLSLAARCTELTVPPIVEEAFIIPPPASGPAVELKWEGSDVNDSEWIRSYTVYRIVFDDLENTSGSIRDLLEPGLIQSLHRSEMILAESTELAERNADSLEKFKQGSADCVWTVRMEQTDLSYYPRREFVQTPGGIRPGHIVALFRYTYCLDSDCQDYRIERTTRTHTDEAPARLETEASLILKQMETDAYDFLAARRNECGQNSEVSVLDSRFTFVSQRLVLP
ncbi:MAG TPA: hypothetical protein DEA96_18185 [Leptospiraceae bacterium]|mgnify:CR=1 FL=1|nr:hypothetical protein [Spirochaetaceae bacterium]HBS06905.1 hypothetical protein [Leptospiraceae bacterium]|tara:strand:- start:3326 stop:4126 length:801 start_codon:yes stop_codon:yes gene_type:complete